MYSSRFRYGVNKKNNLFFMKMKKNFILTELRYEIDHS